MYNVSGVLSGCNCQIKMNKILKSKKVWIILMIIIGIISYFVADDYIVKQKREKNLEIATLNYEQSLVNVMKASLNLYYVNVGSYPINIDSLKEHFTKIGQSIENISEAETKLNNFEYEFRGDKQAVQIKYINYNGEEKVVEFSYKDDFH